MGRLHKWLAPLVEDLAKAIVTEQDRQNPQRIRLPDPQLSEAQRAALRLAWVREFRGSTRRSSYRGRPNEDVLIGR